ncbi:MAG: hypothetical protein K0A89_05695 [ANME-2 cluster archaeon]|nr:hypothetical protein [ANME-2 cluster archaeon]
MKSRNIIGIIIVTSSSISFLLAGTNVVTSGPLIAAGLSLGMLLIISSIFVMIYGLLISKHTIERVKY